MSMASMRAAGWGERSVWPHNIPSAKRSEAKAKRPCTLGTPSGRGADEPISGTRGVATTSAGAAVVVSLTR